MVEVVALFIGTLGVAAGQGPATWTASPESATIGDTILLERTLPAPAGATARARPLSRTPSLEPLTDPVIERDGDVLTVRYTIAVFEPGTQLIPMPTVEVFYADGSSENILGDTARVVLRSVLPAGDSLPRPQPSLAPVARPIRRAMPAVLLAVLVLVGSGLWALLRRRTAVRPAPVASAATRARPPLGTWVDAGELRAVASEVATALRREFAHRVPAAHTTFSADVCLEVLRRERPEWPLDDIADVLHALDRARFAPAVPQDVMALAEQARMVVEQLARKP
jgi:hypothetical protein